MSEENTQNLPDTRSFEERVFARFDTLDARMARMESGLDNLNTRVERLEAESERRAIDTKPIWERALAEIVALSQKVDGLERKVDALQEEVAFISRKVDSIELKVEGIAIEMLELRVDNRQLRKRMDRIDSEHAR